jgi:hypothetical protein
MLGLGMYGPASVDAKNGRLSPASLDIDTCGCPSTFGDPACEKRTSWELDKTTETGGLIEPSAEPFLFNVQVVEGPTSTILTGEGQLIITNSGEQTPSLSSVAVLLEDYVGDGTGDAPGPSGKSWLVKAAAVENEFAACGDTAPTAYGLISQTDGSNLVLIDPDSNDVIALSDRVLIPPTLDNDGDGLRDEDAPTPPPGATQNSCSAYDNDGDGKFDEDPTINGVDEDNDGSDGEDPLDDDGDGQVDEDSACEDAVVINFEFEFDITGLGLEGPGDGIVPSADDLRIDLLVTFDAIGRRGGSTPTDIDCNGTIDDDEKDVRTIQQRHQFDPPACTELCQSVTLVDTGPEALDPTCVDVDTTFNDANANIAATGTAGTEYNCEVSGTVTCIGSDCSTAITNTATLTGAGCDDDNLIEGSPASASFYAMCSDTPPGPGETPEPGDFCSQTQGGWGSGAAGNNPGRLRDTAFDTVFPAPDHLIVGDPDGPDADSLYAILLTSSGAVEAYLPAGGPPAALTADQTNPETTSSGVFGGQLTAATLNIGFDAAGIGLCTLTGTCTFPHPPGTLGTLVYGDCVDDDLQGLSVNQVIALANTAISGGGLPAGVTFSDLSDALSKLNQEFVDCDTVATGCLALPTQ